MVRGQVEVRENVSGQFAPARAGQEYGVGTEIRTGADGVIALYRNTLSLIVLDQNSVMLVKKLGFKSGQPITILSLITGAAAVDHKGKLPAGALLAIETPGEQQSGVAGSTIRVSYNPETRLTTATCTSGECNLVKGDQTLGLREGQQVDVAGLDLLPDMPDEMSTEQANQFLAMANQMCGCELPVSEVRDVELDSLTPPPDDVPTPEEDLENSADENGNTDPETDEMSSGEIDQVINEVMEEQPVATEEPAATMPDATSEQQPVATEEPAVPNPDATSEPT
jgi:hypothetical protein